MSDLVSIALNESLLRRLKGAAEFAAVPWTDYPTLDEIVSLEEKLSPKMILLSVVDIAVKEEVSGQVQTLRQFFPESFIFVLAEKRMTPTEAAFVKKSGGNFVMLVPEFLETIRLEYILSQVVKTSFVPVGADDFKVGTSLDFTVFTKLTLNKKVIPVIHPGTVINQGRIDKLKTAGELQVRRAQVDLFSKYVNESQDNSATGTNRRCRAQLQTVANIHVNLVLTLTDQAEAVSFDKGRDLLKKFTDLCEGLMKNLAVVEDPWDVIDQSILGNLGATDRSVVIAALAALTSLKSGIGIPDDILLAGLFCDLGMLALSPQALGRINSLQQRTLLGPEDLQTYYKHPIVSLNMLLERKIQLSDRVKEIILCTHEQANRQGFPGKITPEKIPVESSLILMHELIDLECRPKGATERPSYISIRKKIFEKERENPEFFSLLMLEKIRVAFGQGAPAAGTP